MTPTIFRQVFPAFQNAGIYTDIAINYYIGLATPMLDPVRWGATLDYGIGLFVAHYCVLDARDIATAKLGGIPGDVRGPATAKSVDKVSQGYDTRAVTFDNGAFWNQSRYGVQLMHYARQFGAGGLQLGPPAPVNSQTPLVVGPPFLV